MNPKDKANELIEQHLKLMLRGDFPSDFFRNQARLHALVSVDQAFESMNKCLKGWLDSDVLAYWEEVKKQLQTP